MSSKVDSRHTRICWLQIGITGCLRLGMCHEISHRVKVGYVHRLAAIVGRSTINAVALFALCQQGKALVDTCRLLLVSTFCIVAISEGLSEIDVVVGPDGCKLHRRIVLCIGLCIEAVVGSCRYLAISITEVTVGITRFHISGVTKVRIAAIVC